MKSKNAPMKMESVELSIPSGLTPDAKKKLISALKGCCRREIGDLFAEEALEQKVKETNASLSEKMTRLLGLKVKVEIEEIEDKSAYLEVTDANAKAIMLALINKNLVTKNEVRNMLVDGGYYITKFGYDIQFED